MTHGEVQAALEAHPWTYAKTYPTIPHYWSARNQWDYDQYVAVCHFIEENGRLEQFRKLPIKNYFYTGGYRYWIMGTPETTSIINRCDPKHPKLEHHIRVI